MNLRQISEYLCKSSAVPTFGTGEYQQWLELKDALGFLVASSSGSVPVYISAASEGFQFFLYGVFTPKTRLADDYATSLLDWSISPTSAWGYGVIYDEESGEPRKALFPPLNRTGTPVLDGAEPIFFSRKFHGYPDPNYVELNQRFAQVTDIHWMPDRQAYCRLNAVGDLENGAQIAKSDHTLICTVERVDLDFYMAISDAVMVQVFDILRTNDPTDVPRSPRKVETYTDVSNELYARRTITAPTVGPSRSAWLRGAHIIRTQITDEEMADPRWSRERKERKYESFIAFDFKHGEVRECSTDPEQLGNYFVESDLPFGTSPAFFRPEVLARYQQNPDKYTFEWRTLRCRGAWSLPYDVNDEGQVFAYLKDLSHLPHSEQVYWKSFNEEPKTGISQRALKADFLGEWDLDYDPLESLQSLLRDFPKATHNGQEVAIWEFAKGVNSTARERMFVHDNEIFGAGDRRGEPPAT